MEIFYSAFNYTTKMLLNKLKTITNHKIVLNIYLIVLCCLINSINCEHLIDEYDGNSGLYSIEGKVYAPEIYSSNDLNWQRDTVITINNGEYSGFLKEDGTFAINSVPSGSYVVEVSNPDYYYESVSHFVWFTIYCANVFNANFIQISIGSSGNQSKG